jgi:hypothetical protein
MLIIYHSVLTKIHLVDWFRTRNCHTGKLEGEWRGMQWRGMGGKEGGSVHPLAIFCCMINHINMIQSNTKRWICLLLLIWQIKLTRDINSLRVVGYLTTLNRHCAFSVIRELCTVRGIGNDWGRNKRGPLSLFRTSLFVFVYLLSFGHNTQEISQLQVLCLHKTAQRNIYLNKSCTNLEALLLCQFHDATCTNNVKWS